MSAFSAPLVRKDRVRPENRVQQNQRVRAYSWSTVRDATPSIWLQIYPDTYLGTSLLTAASYVSLVRGPPTLRRILWRSQLNSDSKL